MTAALQIMMILGGVSLLLLVVLHQRLLPLERIRVDPTWEPVNDAGAPPDQPVAVSEGRVRVRYPDGVEHEFSARGMDLSPAQCAVTHLGQRRLLAALDRGADQRTWLVDTERASQGGDLEAGVLGWWRHGTGFAIAGAGSHVIEVHRCFGRDRIYWVDPLDAMSGHALARGVERTIIAPVRRVDRVEFTGRQIRVSRGERTWVTDATAG